MNGAGMGDMFDLVRRAAKLPPCLRLQFIGSLKRYCSKCGRAGKKEARGYGFTALSCEGGKGEYHERIEWEAEI